MGLDHKSLLIGIAVGYLLIPALMGAVAAKRNKK